MEQISKEIHNAAIMVPRAIILSIFINGIVGFASFVAALFCLGDPNTVFGSRFLYPFIQIFLQATNSVAGSAIMVSLLIIVVVALTIGTMAAASRMLWAFTRDYGVPG